MTSDDNSDIGVDTGSWTETSFGSTRRQKFAIGLAAVFAAVMAGFGVYGIARNDSGQDESQTQNQNQTAETVAQPQEATTASFTKPEHIVLLMTDDQGFGQAGYLGHPTLKTPNLDAMAASGTVLDQFYAQAPICSPTRVSILTAEHPYRRDCFTVGGCSLDHGVTTLADSMSMAGYSTAHFGKWHIGNLGNQGRRVNSNDTVTPDKAGFDTYFTHQLFFDIGQNEFYTNDGFVTVDVTQDTSVFLAEKAITHITEQVQAGQPSFTIVWYPSPHSDYISADEFADSDSTADQLYGEIKGFDESVGMIRTALKDLGIADSTFLMFNSDNGASSGRNYPDNFANAGLRGGKNSLYQGGIRVPAIIEYPGLSMPSTVSTPISTIDIMPTLLELTGAAVPPALDGVSRVAALQGQPDPNGLYFWYDGEVEQVNSIDESTAAYIQWPNKLIKNGADSYEQYDLSIDPNETNDIYSVADSASLVTALESWQAGILAN